MSNYSHETAPTRIVEAADNHFAYRRFGPSGGTPLVLLNYFAANMDDWDPNVTNGLAAEHDVVISDYPGVGGSSGQTPPTVAGLTRSCVEFCRALDLRQFDIVGFSLGGMIAQQIAADHPDLVRRVILLGTGPRGGEGMAFNELSAEEQADPTALLKHAFFTPSDASQAAARAYIERLKSRTAERDVAVSGEAAAAELAAIREWGAIPATDRFAMLSRIPHPTLIVHGSKDVVVIPVNAFLLATHLPNAKLIMYPDSSHGAQSQHSVDFLRQVNSFLL